MTPPLFWNHSEKRLRSGWRVLIQILLSTIPLAVLGMGGYYSGDNQTLRIALTAGPITILSVILCSRFIDKRKLSDLGIQLRDKSWWVDYGAGILVGFLSASVLVLMIRIFGWGEIVTSGQWRIKLGPFIGSFLIAFLVYLIVGIFEELMRSYQIKNLIEGLTGTKLGLIGAGLMAVLVGALWSGVGHLASRDLSFLVFILITALIYGLYILWTGKAALAMAAHFAWDFTLSGIFQFGATSETSLYFVRLGEMPDLAFEMTSLLGIIAKTIGFLLVLLWIWKKKKGIRISSNLAIIQS